MSGSESLLELQDFKRKGSTSGGRRGGGRQGSDDDDADDVPAAVSVLPLLAAKAAASAQADSAHYSYAHSGGASSSSSLADERKESSGHRGRDAASSPRSLSDSHSSGPIVVAHNVHKTYLLGVEGVPALRGVSLSIARGEFLMILGSSGGGKTSLLNILGTIDKPTKGELHICGHKITSSTSDEEFAYLRLKKIGFVFQTFNLLPSMTAEENVSLPMILEGRLSPAEIKERARELLDRVGLGERLDHLPSQLSGGEQQRCLSSSSLLLTPTGTIRAGDVTKGTLLLSPSLEPVAVVDCLRGRDPHMYRIEYSLRGLPSSHTVTADHLVTLAARVNPCATVNATRENSACTQIVEVRWLDRTTLKLERQTFRFLTPEWNGNDVRDGIAFALEWLAALERKQLASPLRVGDLVEMRASDLMTRVEADAEFDLHFALCAVDLSPDTPVARAGCGGNFTKITKISRVPGGEFMGIRLDSQDQRMLLADGIITHNCTIARAIANKPAILLLDEPTGDLDTVNGTLILSLLLHLNRRENITCIMVTHDTALKAYAHRVVHMVDGKVARLETIETQRRAEMDAALAQRVAQIRGEWSGEIPVPQAPTTEYREAEDYESFLRAEDEDE